MAPVMATGTSEDQRARQEIGTLLENIGAMRDYDTSNLPGGHNLADPLAATAQSRSGPRWQAGTMAQFSIR